MTASTSHRQPWTVRVASWSARHRWPVFGLWFVLTIGLFVASLAAGGTLTADAVDNDREDQTTFESARAYDVFNAAGAATEEPVHRTLIVVGAADGPLADAALNDVLAHVTAATAEVDGASEPLFANVVDPRLAPPEAGLMSADRSTVRIAPDVPGEGDALDARLAAMRSFIDELRAAHPDLRIHSLDGTLANEDIQELVNGGLDASLRLTIPLTFLILLIAFGAVVAAVVPLVLAITALLAAFGVLGLYSQAVAPGQPVRQPAHRPHRARRRGRLLAVHDHPLPDRAAPRAPAEDAIRVASATAGRAVFFSGLAVMFSIGGLFLLDDVLFRSMAIGTISVVLIAVIGSLTFLPAILSILGDDVNRLRVPFLGRDRPEGSGVWAAMVRRVMRRPVISFVGAGGLLLLWPFPRCDCTSASPTSPRSRIRSTASRASTCSTRNGRRAPRSTLQVVVTKADEPATQAAIEQLHERVLAIDGLSEPIETPPSADGRVALISYVMARRPERRSNQDIVREVRRDVVPRSSAASPASRPW